ncbi:MAG: cupin domain-containing protein [Geminicoccaceae bacterium]
MVEKQSKRSKHIIVTSWNNSKNYMMAVDEFTGIVVGKDATNSEYVIRNGVIAPGASIPDHYHKWEDQTFHIIEGRLEAKIGDAHYSLGSGDTAHCPRGVSHFMKNVGQTQARLISYIFPGDWAESFMAETSRQNQNNQRDLELIEERFGVVYL